MSVTVPSNPRELQDFQFKLICRLRIFSGQDTQYNGSYSLIAPASKYGLIFVGVPNGLQVISLSSIIEAEHASGGGEVSNYPRREIPLPSQPTNLSVSCDQSHLAVAVMKDGCALALVYNIPSFLSKTVSLVKEVRLSTNPNSQMLELLWNPGIPNVMASCHSDGTVGVFEFKATGIDINTLPPEARATCFSWSPKGKQLVVGSLDGSLTQYKPDLKAVKHFPAPHIFPNPAAVVNVLWISNFQFAAVYRDQVNESERPALVIVNAPKAGPVNYVNYEDICYSCGDLRKPQFYLLHQPNWNVLVVGSANSMEVGVLGLAEDQLSWEQWSQEDAARAELPLTANKEETFPLGMGLDTSTRRELPWGENQSIPPMPVLLLLSHHGVLCLFYAINLRPGAPTLCTPPERLADESGLAFFTSAPAAPTQASPAKPQPQLPLSPQQSKSSSFSDWGTPVIAADTNRTGIRINLTEKFDSFSTQQQQQQQQQQEAISNPVGSNLFKMPAESNKLMFNFNSGGLTSSTPGSTSVGLLATPAPSGMGFSFSGPAFSLPVAASKPPAQQQQQVQQQLQFLQQPPPLPPPQPHQLQQPSQQQLQQPPPQQQPPPVGNTIKPQASLFGSMAGTSPSTGGLQPLTSDERTDPISKQAAPRAGTEVVQKASGTEVMPPTSLASNLKRTRDGNSSVFQAAIVNEMSLFQKELLGLKAQVKKLNVEVGTLEEKALLCQKAHTMEEFCRELQETTQAQSVEVCTLKAMQVEAFSWVEDAKSRDQQLSNPQYLQLTQAQELDPVSTRYLASVRHLVYYVESQLRQVNECLDLQWLQFEEMCKEKIKGKMYIPSMEAVYQAMVMQNKILAKLRVDVGIFMNKVDKKKKSKVSRSVFVQNLGLSKIHAREKGDSDLSQLAESLLQMKLGTTMDTASMEDISSLVAAGRYSAVAARNRKLTSRKQAKLRELLAEHPVGHVRPVKPLIQQRPKLVPREHHSLTSLSNMVAKTSLDNADTESAPVDILGQFAKSMFIKYGKQPEQTPTGFNFKSNLSPLLNTSPITPTPSPSNEENGKQPDISAGNVSSLEPVNTPPTSVTSAADTSAKPTTNFVFGGGITKGTTSVSSTFSFTAAGTPNIPMFGIGVSKPASSTPPVFSFLSGATPATTAQSTPNIPLFGSLKSSTSNAATNFSFTQLSSSFATTTTASTTTPILSSTSVTRSIFDGNQLEKPASSVSSVTQEIEGDSTDQSATKASSSIFGGGLLKNPPPSTNFSFASAVTTGSSQTPASTIKSIFGGSQAKSSTAEPPSVPGGEEIEPTSPEDNQDQTSSLSSFNFESVTITPITTETAQGSAPAPTQSTSSITSIFGGGAKSSTSQSSGFNLEQLGVSLSPAPAVTTASDQAPVTKPTTPFSAFSLPATSTTAAIAEAASSSTSFSFSLTTTSTTISTPALFGNKSAIGHAPVTTTSTSSFFGQPICSPSSVEQKTSITTSFFGAGATTAVPAFFGAAGSTIPTTASSFFGVASATTVPALFGAAAATTTTTATPSLLGITTTTSTATSLFGAVAPMTAAPATSLFGTATTTTAPPVPSLFGTATTTTAPPAPSLFGTATTTTAPLPLFGTAADSTTAPSLFGTVTATTTPTPSLFGSAAATTSAPSLFGSASSPTQQSVFGTAAATTTAPAPSLFGASTATTTAPSLFGTAASTTAPVTSLFGAASAAASTTAPAPTLFGAAAATTAATAPSLFGVAAATTTAPSLFGSVGATATTTPSLFGTATTGTSTPSLFGSPATTSASSPFGGSGGSGTSLFGTTPAASTPTLFGNTPATSTPSFFGQAVATTASSIFGQSTAATTTASSIFGQSSSSNVFGQAASSTGSSFLGGGSAAGGFGSKPLFGQSGGSLFGQSSGTSFGSSGGSIFGGSSTFGGGNAFQPAGGSVFGGASAQTSPTGGAFSSGLGQSISQSGFGAPPSFQSKPGGFGGSPVFGQTGASGFGAPATFGGQPIFGSSPTFGSPGGGFGSSSPTQQSSTFENLATQNTMTFGNLASSQGTTGFGSDQSVFGSNNQTTPPNQPTFSNSPSFGGSSFSSWR